LWEYNYFYLANSKILPNMSSFVSKPATTGAVELANRLDERLFSMGIDNCPITTPNGNKVAMSWMVRGPTAYKVNIYCLKKVGGYIIGQIQINKDMTNKTTYQNLIEVLTKTGFRHELVKPDGREHFIIPGTSDEGKPTRIDIIEIKTDVILDAFPKFIQLINEICKFDGIQLSPPAPSTIQRRFYVAPKAPTVPVAVMPPHPDSGEWVPFRKQQTQMPPQMAPQVAMFFRGTLPQLPLVAAAPVNVEQEIDSLRKRLAELERVKKIADFEEKQRADREAFEKSLME
jgi:hypothetical protein